MAGRYLPRQFATPFMIWRLLGMVNNAPLASIPYTQCLSYVTPSAEEESGQVNTIPSNI